MKKWEYIAGALLVLFTAAMIALALKSLRLTESEKLEQNIDSYEKEIQEIKARRDSANAVPIPMSESERKRILDSVNKRHGFNLSVRPA